VLGVAFKEWAVICKALADGRQSLILRKGGIAESGGEFRPEHSRFWLYPTYLHEHRNGVKPEAGPLFDQALAEQPPLGQLAITHFADVAGVFEAKRWESVAALDDLHVWSDEAVRAKFSYRRPGLFVLPVRVYKAAWILQVAESPTYAGCRTWVQLDRRAIEYAFVNAPGASAITLIGKDQGTERAAPVLDDNTFAAALTDLDRRLNPEVAIGKDGAIT
jgi:hypothetical protein